MPEIVLLVAVLALLAVVAAMVQRQPARAAQVLEEQHRRMLADMHEALSRLGDRMVGAQGDQSEKLQAGLHALRTEMMTQTLAKLAEQGREDQKLIQESFRNATLHLAGSVEALEKKVDARLEQISGRVSERLDEGFKKTNETFVSVMARLATIDEAQKKIDGLTSNVVSLQELLGDKRSRGAFGEVQLEGLVRNILSSNAYEFQYTLPNGTRADCVLKLPEPTGMVAVDAKFPLENYHRMFEGSEAERTLAARQFKADVKKHVDDIAGKYIIRDVTSDGAVMFVPAEAVFAEIHAHHPDVVDYAMQRRVWVVSPTTLMAVLNTARAVMKDVETRRQVHIIKDELGKLGKDFGRFDERMRKLADHIRQANKDAEDVQISSRKISEQFARIERVELDHPPLLQGDDPE
jgi:DNA recombination protein RmuC